MADPDGPDVVTDALFGGRLVLNQFRTGHRAGTDAVLLAAAAQVGPGDRFIDVGSGSGAVGLGLALREPSASGVLLEVHPGLAALARRNIEANGVSGRVVVGQIDLFGEAACRDAGLAGSASLVVSNPPFYRASDVRGSPDPLKSSAHVLSADASHGSWLRRSITLLAAHGRLVVIHRPDALPELLAAIDSTLGGVVLRAVHPRGDRSASRVLVSGRKGSRAPLAIAPALILHDAEGRFTPEIEALNAGASTIDWPE